jgi:hypothetical protein
MFSCTTSIIGKPASLTPEERAMFLELMELVIGTPNPFGLPTEEK